MAQRDRSQGFGFVYVDLAKILAQREGRGAVDSSRPVLGPIQTTGVTSVNFNKDPLPPEETPAESDRATAIQQIRENLDRLQSLHHKLHAMLEELNQVSDKKKR